MTHQPDLDMYEPDQPRLLLNGRVEGLEHTCEGTSREQECRACTVMERIEEGSQFDPGEWAATVEDTDG